MSFVDPDDVVEPGAFSACIEMLETNKNLTGAWTNSILINDTGVKIGVNSYRGMEFTVGNLLRHPTLVHQLVVMRRSAVTPVLPFLAGLTNYAPWVLYVGVAAQGGFERVTMDGYRWRQHPRGMHLNPDIGKARLMARDAIRRYYESLRQL